MSVGFILKKIHFAEQVIEKFGNMQILGKIFNDWQKKRKGAGLGPPPFLPYATFRKYLPYFLASFAPLRLINFNRKGAKNAKNLIRPYR
jgi:hypothetical protein